MNKLEEFLRSLSEQGIEVISATFRLKHQKYPKQIVALVVNDVNDVNGGTV